jgi:hypothetical protein
MAPKKVRVGNAAEFEKRRELFATLALLHHLVISPSIAADEADAIICFGALDAVDSHGIPSIHFPSSEQLQPQIAATIDFIDAQLSGITFSNKSFQTSSVIPSIAFSPSAGARVIASQDAIAIWFVERRGSINCHHSLIPPKELRPHGALKDLLCANDFISLFPLLHFLREVGGSNLPALPPPRASFIVDDPNVRSTRYGFIDYRELIGEAREHEYHVSIATIPLDWQRASRSAVDLFRSNPEQLSLMIHGNNHTFSEFMMRETGACSSTLRQIDSRLQLFQQKHRLEIENVLTAPHGMMSREMLSAISLFDFSGAVISRPFPWHAHDEREEQIHETTSFSKWYPADFIEGTPIILRMKSFDDTPFKFYLGIPAIYYFHHWDFKEGYGNLREIAERVRSFADARWEPLKKIFASNYTLANKGDGSVEMQIFSKRFEFSVPDGIDNLILSVVNNLGENTAFGVKSGNAIFPMMRESSGVYASGKIAVEAGTTFSGTLVSGNPPGDDPRLHLLALTGTPFYPLARRWLTQIRDRAKLRR